MDSDLKYNAKLKSSILKSILKSKSIETFLSQPEDQRANVYKKMLTSQAWVRMGPEADLDAYPLMLDTFYLYGPDVEDVLGNANLISEARESFWSTNAFTVDATLLRELIAWPRAKQAIRQIRVEMRATSPQSEKTSQYSDLEKLLLQCKQLDWVVIIIQGGGGRRVEDLVKERAAEVSKILEKWLTTQSRSSDGPKRGVYLYTSPDMRAKQPVNGTWETRFEGDKSSRTAVDKEVMNRDKVDNRLRKKQCSFD